MLTSDLTENEIIDLAEVAKMIVEQMKYKLSVETGGFLDATRKIKNETEDMKTKVKRNTVSWLNVDKAAKENKEAKEAEHRRELLFGTGSEVAGESKPTGGTDVIGGRLGSGRKLKSGETYKYETGEYYDANGNIVNPVETDAGTISMDRLLDAVAFRESRGNPSAKNPHSTATGAWQFVEGTARDNGLPV